VSDHASGGMGRFACGFGLLDDQHAGAGFAHSPGER
jgi:hypothetical protein